VISVSIYDDNKHRRESLITLLELSEDMILAGAYENCMHIVEDIKKDAPHIILMDIEMPGMSGIEGVAIAKEFFPEVKVIMQTAFDDDEKIFAALQAGAEGYILKSATVVQIIQGIHEVMKGGASMSPSIAIKVIRYFNQKENQKEDYKLTAKEFEVLKLLAQGNSYKMVADVMGISHNTVSNHIKKVYVKLQVHSLGEAIALAHKEKLV